jgi:hypothetical protein
MRWATRAGIHVDRTACAWLIRRFIDPEAVSVFVHDPDEREGAKRGGKWAVHGASRPFRSPAALIPRRSGSDA